MKLGIKNRTLWGMIFSIFMLANSAVAQALPGEPAPPDPSTFAHLSTQDGLNQAIDWAKFGKTPDGSKIEDAAIAAITVGYPPAGIALGLAKSLLDSLSAGPDPTGEALKELDARLSEVEARVAKLEQDLNALNNRELATENRERLRWLHDAHDKIAAVVFQLRQKPADQSTKNLLVEQARLTAAGFLPTSEPNQDLWLWSDLLIQNNNPTMLAPDFKVLPAYEYYVASVITLMAAVDYASDGDSSYLTSNKQLQADLLAHAAYLSVRPEWRRFFDPAQTLPENLLTRVDCWVQATSSSYPDANGKCYAGFWCADAMRRLKVGIGSPIAFQNANPKGMCMLPAYTKRVSDADQQNRAKLQQQNCRAPYAANPTWTPSSSCYGTQAISLWEQWNGPRDRQYEIENENQAGLDQMTQLADKLYHMATTGTMREQFIGQFDMTFYTPEYLYAEKLNGEVLWYGHMIGVDKNVPQPATRNPLSAQAATKGLAQPSAGRFSATQTRNLASSSSNTSSRMSAQSLMTSASSKPHLVHRWNGPNLVAKQWQSFQQLIPAGDSGVYALAADGTLRLYCHDGFANGTTQWTGPVTVGTGWNAFKQIFAGGDGVLYGIGADGSLRWYRQTDSDKAQPFRASPADRQQIPSPHLEGPLVVSSGWGSYTHVFSTGEGVIYAITTDGRLLWFHHTGYLTGANTWEGPKQVNSGWAGFKTVFSPGAGIIYAIKNTGELIWYQNDGYKTGVASWQGPTQIAADWGSFTHVFPHMWGTPRPVQLQVH